MSDVSVSCKCGSLKGVLHNCSAKSGTRVVCYCKDCQAGARALGAEHLLNERGGVDLFQTLPSALEITEGAQHLACQRLSPKGLMRWYASCCDTPMFNTLGTQKLRFLGVLTHVIDGDPTDAFGPVQVVANVASAASGSETLKEYGVAKAVQGVLVRHLHAVISGKRNSPFIDVEGKPVVTPYILTLEERHAATNP